MEIKYPFILFSNELQDNCNCDCVLPVSEGGDIAFFSDVNIEDVAYVLLSGDLIKYAEDVIYGDANLSAQLTDDLSKIFAKGECFRIRHEDASGDIKYYSNPLVYVGCEVKDTHVFEYWDNEEMHQKVRISCTIKEPQSKTEKSEYVDSNGIVHSLSKTRRKEIKFTSDFYPEVIHDAIEEMLMYPHILMDGIPIYESGDYSIEWEESDENNNARATTKLSEQDISRFSICEQP